MRLLLLFILLVVILSACTEWTCGDAQTYDPRTDTCSQL
jgi:hypothetical protein